MLVFICVCRCEWCWPALPARVVGLCLRACFTLAFARVGVLVVLCSYPSFSCRVGIPPYAVDLCRTLLLPLRVFSCVYACLAVLVVSFFLSYHCATISGNNRCPCFALYLLCCESALQWSADAACIGGIRLCVSWRFLVDARGSPHILSSSWQRSSWHARLERCHTIPPLATRSCRCDKLVRRSY